MYAVVHGLPLPAGDKQVPPDIQTQWRHAFGQAAIRVANEFQAGLADLPPDEQEAERHRIEVLRRASQMLLSDRSIPENPHTLLDAGV